MKKKNYDNFKYDILKVFHSKVIGKKSRIDLRIVKWEHSEKPVLEYRKLYIAKKDDVEEWRMAKTAGIDADVFQVIVDKADEIFALLKAKPEE